MGEATLQALVGSYVGGSVAVFHGTASASDSIPLEPTAELSFSQQAVVAALDVRETNPADYPDASGTAAFLTIHAVAAQDYVVLEQTGTTTHVGLVLASDQSSGQGESCDGCAPDLMSKPTAVEITMLTASGTVSDGTPQSTTVSAQLDVVAPSMVTFADITVLGFPDPNADVMDVGAWQLVGDEEVATATGQFFEAGGLVEGCAMWTPFTVQVYVNAANLNDFGARDYMQGSSTKQCGP